MPVTFDNGVVELHRGDARQVLRELPAESVHCVVTSPPYWGLRDYDLEPLVWGGDEGHEHKWGKESYQRRSNDGGKTDKQLSNAGANDRDRPVEHAFCPCGAWRGSLGLEPSIDLYVQHIVEVFREVRRVLRKDGTLWLNMGDSYASQPSGSFGKGNNGRGMEGGEFRVNKPFTTTGAGLKPKDLCMMPARVALALQADGWWLRSDIVWSKPNPMPESVTDRPTTSHEYLFLLTKAERYYYDADAIREQGQEWLGRAGMFSRDGAVASHVLPGQSYAQHRERDDRVPPGRNKRSVWEIATEPYPEAHFATFPQKLVEPCILAGTSERGVCADCGAPWERVLKREHYGDLIPKRDMETGITRNNLGGQKVWDTYKPPETTGWRRTCDCGHKDTVPGTVLDPFAGSGTVAYVAQRLGRRGIGIELSEEYLALAETRMTSQSLPMNLEAGHG